MATSKIEQANYNIYRYFGPGSGGVWSVPAWGTWTGYFVGIYRSTSANNKSGTAFIVIDSGNCAVLNKSGLDGSLSNVSFSSQTMTLTLDIGSYMSCFLIVM